MSNSETKNEVIMPDSQLPPWVQTMRAAAMKVIKQEDVEAMVKAQVDKAKKGDEKAMKFVFEQILGGAQMKGATFVQNNYQLESNAAAAAPAVSSRQQLEDRTIGLICEQCGYEPEQPDRTKPCPKCNAKRWEHKGLPKMQLRA